VRFPQLGVNRHTRRVVYWRSRRISSRIVKRCTDIRTILIGFRTCQGMIAQAKRRSLQVAYQLGRTAGISDCANNPTVIPDHPDGDQRVACRGLPEGVERIAE